MTNSGYISYSNTLFLKGVAILCVLLHNFFHLLPPVTYQNEMVFNKKLFFRFIEEFTWPESLNAFFSFWAFYGVFIFLFLSGYGMAKSWIHSKEGEEKRREEKRREEKRREEKRREEKRREEKRREEKRREEKRRD